MTNSNSAYKLYDSNKNSRQLVMRNIKTETGINKSPDKKISLVLSR